MYSRWRGGGRWVVRRLGVHHGRCIYGRCVYRWCIYSRCVVHGRCIYRWWIIHRPGVSGRRLGWSVHGAVVIN